MNANNPFFQTSFPPLMVPEIVLNEHYTPSGIKKLLDVGKEIYTNSIVGIHECRGINEDEKEITIRLSASQIIIEFWDELSINVQKYLKSRYTFSKILTSRPKPTEEWLLNFDDVKRRIKTCIETKYLENVEEAFEYVKRKIHKKDIVRMLLESVEKGYVGVEICENKYVDAFSIAKKREIIRLCDERFKERGLCWEDENNEYRIMDVWFGKAAVTLLVEKDLIDDAAKYDDPNIALIHERIVDYKGDTRIKKYEERLEKMDEILKSLEYHPLVGPEVSVARDGWNQQLK